MFVNLELIIKLIVSRANGACFLSRLRARTIISKFQGFNALEGACPAVIEGKGLGEGLANDVACLVRIEEFGVKRNDLNCEGGALGGELGIEGFQMKEDCLFGLEHLFCALAGNRNENEMFLVHDNTMFKNLTTTLTTSSAGEQHTPAAGGVIYSTLTTISTTCAPINSLGRSRELVVKTIQVNWVVN